MELNEYQTRAMETCMETSKNFTYMTYGLMAEVGEIADKVAKWRRKGIARITDDRLVFNTSDEKEVREHLLELMREVGDVMWFVSGLCSVCGYKLEEVGDMNLNKLHSRQERGVIDGNGDNR